MMTFFGGWRPRDGNPSLIPKTGDCISLMVLSPLSQHLESSSFCTYLYTHVRAYTRRNTYTHSEREAFPSWPRKFELRSQCMKLPKDNP